MARGGFHPERADGVPSLPDGRACRTLVLLGNAGPAIWDTFRRAAEFKDAKPDPMNRWSQRVITGLAEKFRATPLFPFIGPPYLPFLRWAQRAEAVYPSPLGMLIHPDYGLWHAYRGALSFACLIDLPQHTDATSPCESCAAKPCLTVCPVDAFSSSGYDVPRCVGHISSAIGDACVSGGCLARRACPVGAQYEPAQARFHMVAFVAAQTRHASAE